MLLVWFTGGLRRRTPRDRVSAAWSAGPSRSRTPEGSLAEAAA